MNGSTGEEIFEILGSWRVASVIWLASALAIGAMSSRAGAALRAGEGDAAWHRASLIAAGALAALVLWHTAALCAADRVMSWQGEWAVRDALLRPRWYHARYEPPWPLAAIGIGLTAWLATGSRASTRSRPSITIILTLGLLVLASAVANLDSYHGSLVWEIPLLVLFLVLGPLRPRRFDRAFDRWPRSLPQPWALALSVAAIGALLPLLGRSVGWFGALFWVPFLDALGVFLGIVLGRASRAFLAYGCVLGAWVAIPLIVSDATPDQLHVDYRETGLAMLSPVGILWLGADRLLEVLTTALVTHWLAICAIWLALRVAIAWRLRRGSA